MSDSLPSESNLTQPTQAVSPKASLELLKELSFSTAWSPSQKQGREPRPSGNPRFSRERSGPRAERPRFQNVRNQREHEKRGETVKKSSFARFELAFYPEDAPFQALVQTLKQSGRTYPLFEIASLILEKEERFVIALSRVRNPKEEAESSPWLYMSIPDGLPFETEKEALEHICRNHLSLFFDEELVGVEAPKGNFSFVYRCPCNGDLITPPNYHRARSLLQEHYHLYHSHQSFEVFQQQLEKASDADSLEAWSKQMSKKVIFRLKGDSTDAPLSFDSLESVQNYILNHLKGKVIKAAKTLRISGKQMKAIHSPEMRRAIEDVLRKERSFPFNTVNHLRGRLKHAHFSLFKRKNIAYVSAIKRRLRLPGLEFSESIQKLVNFLEQNEDLLVSQLSERYLGVDLPSSQEDAQKELDQRLKIVMQDLHWLIKEGYVTEFNDGRLLLSPVATQDKADEAPNEPEEEATSELPSL